MVYSVKWFVLSLVLCYFVLVCFSPFSIAITSLLEERANLSAFRTFVLFAVVCFRSLFVSGKGCDLWLWDSLDVSRTFLYSFCIAFSSYYKFFMTLESATWPYMRFLKIVQKKYYWDLLIDQDFWLRYIFISFYILSIEIFLTLCLLK